MNSFGRRFVLLLSLALTPLLVNSQEQESGLDQKQDSLTTPFRKGRWLSGLNGSFSSTNLRLEAENEQISTIQYGLEIFTGTFIYDRWFLGLSLLANRTSGSGFIERDLETFTIGPTVSRYFLKDHYGSLYLSGTPGIIIVRDEAAFEIDGATSNRSLEGPGVSIRLRLGYSYVISDKIILDVGLDNSFIWYDVELVTDPPQNVSKDTIFTNSTAFSFGFIVLLDEFFF